MKIGRVVPAAGPFQPALVSLSLCIALLSVVPAAADVVVGVAVPRSGPYVAVGEQVLRGVEAAARDANAMGGLDGQTVTLDVQDDACDFEHRHGGGQPLRARRRAPRRGPCLLERLDRRLRHLRAERRDDDHRGVGGGPAHRPGLAHRLPRLRARRRPGPAVGGRAGRAVPRPQDRVDPGPDPGRPHARRRHEGQPQPHRRQRGALALVLAERRRRHRPRRPPQGRGDRRGLLRRRRHRDGPARPDRRRHGASGRNGSGPRRSRRRTSPRSPGRRATAC